MAKVKCELEKTIVLENVQNKNMGYEVDEKLMKNYVNLNKYRLRKNNEDDIRQKIHKKFMFKK